MTTLAQVMEVAVSPALAMLPAAMDTPQARVLLLAIGLQESRFEHRRQLVGTKPIGPAAGWWQFERSGCKGVLDHAASRYWMHGLCEARECRPNPNALWNRIQHDDVLAAGAARLLLFTDPKPLPDEAGQAWNYYLRNWRPGKPHRGSWAANYNAASEAA